ncbi:MAG: BTAD domain-containing putative transcriptional regulator, partial [Anaerolineae bacterium]
MMARLSISCLGSFQVRLDGQPVTDFKSNKVRALLAYLVVEADRSHRREVLAGLLWPEWPDRDALSNLRYALSDLRGTIGDRAADPPFLLITRSTLQFNAASDHWLDVASFAELGQLDDQSSLDEAATLYRGSFLEGFTLSDSAAFEEWMLFTRERLARRISATLHKLAETCEQRGAFGQAQSYARRQIELEPWDEMAHQHLMRALALAGQRSAALAQYEACRRLLADELGVEPGMATTRLYEQIRDGQLRVLPESPTPIAASPADDTAKLPRFLQEEPPHAERPVFVARERELAQMDRFLDRAVAGEGRVVFITGEAGSGKTALVQAFVRRAQEARSGLIAASGNCNAYTGLGDPYLPFREILELLTGDLEAQWAAGAMTAEYARRLWTTIPQAAQALVDAGPDLIDTFVPRAALLDRAMACAPWPGRLEWQARVHELADRKPVGPGVPNLQQSDLFEQYTRVLQSLARQTPLVLVVDDLQWADLGSMSLLFHLGRHLAGSRILLVGIYRPEEVAIGRDSERHPLQPIVNEFQRDLGEIVVNLRQAERRGFVEALLDSEPNRLGEAFRQMLFQQTRGHPLFTVELLRGMQERGDLVQDEADRWVEGPELDWETLPARVEAVVAERIGRLPEALRAVLRVASVEGETFTAEVVARVRAKDERKMLEHLSGQLDKRHRLIRAHSIQRVDGRLLSRYRFRHFLSQKYLYGGLDQVERVYLHEQVGTALEELYGAQTEGTSVAAVAVQLARHFEEARITEKAIRYLHQAGERALQLSAYDEAITHLTRGLELLTTLPTSLERVQQELALQISLGIAWKGRIPGAEGEKAFLRARELCQQTGQTTQLCQVLGELLILPYVRAEHQTARALAEEALGVAQETGDPILVTLGHWHLGFILFGLGEFTQARDHLQQVISFYEPQQHHRSYVSLRGSDAGVSAMAYDACCLWCLGYPDQAEQRSQEALDLGRQLNHPF